MLKSFLQNIVGSLIMNFGVILYAQAALSDPKVSPLLGSYIRVICNLFLSLLIFYLLPVVRKKSSLFGQRRLPLLAFGALGTTTIMSYFKAVDSLGVATAGFLINSSGSILVVLQFLLVGSISYWHILSAFCCLLGASLLGLDSSGLHFNNGFHWGILAGLSAAIAYFVMGRYLRHEAIISTMFYWSFVNLIFHTIAISMDHKVQFIESWKMLSILVSSGVLAAVGQYWVNASFQTTQSAFIGIVSYLNCVIAMFLEISLFNKSFTNLQIAGAAVIVLTSCLTVIMSHRKKNCTQKLEHPRQRRWLSECDRLKGG